MNNKIKHPRTHKSTWDRSKPKNFGKILSVGIDTSNGDKKRLYVDSLHKRKLRRYYVNEYEFSVFTSAMAGIAGAFTELGKLEDIIVRPATVQEFKNEILRQKGRFEHE